MAKKPEENSAPTGTDHSHLADAVKDSAQQIWLAGLGAFAKAQEEGSKVFEALVKEGTGLQQKTQQKTQSQFEDVGQKLNKAASDFSKQATEGWDRLETVFEDRVARAMHRMGMPSQSEMQILKERVTELEAKVAELGGKTRQP
jgi:poly(hydroxyalkanoate) granule-associated protein